MNPNEMTLFDKFEAVQIFSFFPALTLMVPTRQRVGLRTVNSFYVSLMAGLMFAIGYFTHSNGLMLFAVVNYAIGHWQAYNRYRELISGQAWHTRSYGYTLLERLPTLPQYLRDENRLYRLADPVLLFFIGAALTLIDKPLGIWIAFSAACMRVHEEFMFQKRRKKLLDDYDNAIEAEAHNAELQRILKGEPPLMQSDPRSLGQVSGAGDDIRSQIEKRKAEAEARRTEHRDRFHEGMEQLKGTVEAMRDMAQAANAATEAAAAPEPETIIIATAEHTSETLVMIREETVYVPTAPTPEPETLTTAPEVPQLGSAEADPDGHADPQLPAPPDGTEEAA